MRMFVGFWALLLCTQALLLGTQALAAETLQVGAARVDSTPTVLPACVNGGFFPQYIDKVHDPLHVRALVVDNGIECVAIATADVCIIPEEVTDEAKKRIAAKIPALRPDRIAISSTHCHSAPALITLLGVKADENYVPLFIDRVVDAVTQAYANRTEAEFGWGADYDPKNVFCRRFLMKPGTAWTQDTDFTGSKGDQAQMNPGANIDKAVRRTGQPDPTVSVLYFRRVQDGKPLALLANYSTHYAGAPDISADYFGVFAKEMAGLLEADDHFVAMMTNGTSGDTNCIDFYDSQRRFSMDTVGRSTAEAAKRACDKMQFVRWVPLQMQEELLEIGVRKGTPAQVEKARKHLAALADVGKQPQTLDDVYALGTVIMNDWPNTKKLRLQAIRLGDVGIALLPNETYSFTGTEIRRESPMPMTFTIGLANGYAGYLPPPDQFELGGYTTWRTMSSYCEIGAEPKIRSKLLEMLHAVRK